MSNVEHVARAFLASESTTTEVGSAEYANKLENVRTILVAHGKELDHIQSYTPTALLPILVDLILVLNREARPVESDEFDGADYLDLGNPDVVNEIDHAYDQYSSIDETLIGKLRVTYTRFFFESKSQAERVGIATRLVERCRNQGAVPEELWTNLKAKGGLLDV
jgi:hypothetical protein